MYRELLNIEDIGYIITRTIYYVSFMSLPYICSWFFVNGIFNYIQISKTTHVYIVRFISSVLYVSWLIFFAMPLEDLTKDWVITLGIASLHPQLLLGYASTCLFPAFLIYGIIEGINYLKYRLKGEEIPPRKPIEDDLDIFTVKFLPTWADMWQEIIRDMNAYLPFVLMSAYTLGVIFCKVIPENITLFSGMIIGINLFLVILLSIFTKYASQMALVMYCLYFMLIFLGAKPFVMLDICFMLVFLFLYRTHNDKMIKLY